MTLETLLKSTIVRIGSAALLGAVLGCAATRPAALAGAPCALGERLVCETFVSSRSCRCAAAGDVERALAGFGRAAWPGALR